MLLQRQRYSKWLKTRAASRARPYRAALCSEQCSLRNTACPTLKVGQQKAKSIESQRLHGCHVYSDKGVMPSTVQRGMSSISTMHHVFSRGVIDAVRLWQVSDSPSSDCVDSSCVSSPASPSSASSGGPRAFWLGRPRVRRWAHVFHDTCWQGFVLPSTLGKNLPKACQILAAIDRCPMPPSRSTEPAIRDTRHSPCLRIFFMGRLS